MKEDGTFIGETLNMDEEALAEGMAEFASAKLVHIERKNIKERLKYDFTDTEKLELGRELAREIGEMNSYENELKEVKAQYKAKIEKAQAAINLIQQKVYSGYEYRIFDCELVKDFDTKYIMKIRLDTGESFGGRPMDPDELQQEMNFD